LIRFDRVFKRYPPDIEALTDVSFEMSAGELVTVGGHSGAGKSTLLKLIPAIERPTGGALLVHGQNVCALRRSALPWLRRNIGLVFQDQKLLFDRSALANVLREPAIVDFCELGEMIDQPVRIYSSGMQARLAFAIATAVRPDILIVDEALSVGDAYFQHKSFARIKEFQRAGTAILFVSHDFSAIRTLCDRAALLSDGQILMQGDPAAVLDYYHALIAEKEESTTRQRLEEGYVVTESGTREATLESVALLNARGESVEKLATGDQATLRIVAQPGVRLASLVAGFLIRDRAGNPVYGANSWNLSAPMLRAPAGHAVRFDFSLKLDLGPGSYSVSAALVDQATHLTENYHWCDNILVFEVHNLSYPPFSGVALLPTAIHVSRDYPAGDLNRYGARTYSQFGEDGILAHIFGLIGVRNKSCVEFGGHDGLSMSNVAKLLREEGWRGGFIEADPALHARILENYAAYPEVQALCASVMPDNIESLLRQLGVPSDLDLLCIDIDGNDYWVWKSIENFRPAVVLIECNGAYPPPQRWVMAYNPAHAWQGDDYYGASAQSLVNLAKAKGYELVCCEEQGANLFFVREDLFGALGIADNRLDTLYRPPRYGQSIHGWTHPHRDGPHEIL